VLPRPRHQPTSNPACCRTARTDSRDIEIWAQTTVTAALGEGSAILDTASLHERPGTASLKVVKSIFAPRTTQAASAARTALDTIINGFVKDCGLHSFVTKALDATLVCRYYQPSYDWHSHIIIN
jgi:hypothetical protein